MLLVQTLRAPSALLTLVLAEILLDIMVDDGAYVYVLQTSVRYIVPLRLLDLIDLLDLGLVGLQSLMIPIVVFGSQREVI